MTPRRRQNDQYEPSTARRTVLDDNMRDTWRNVLEIIKQREKRRQKLHQILDKLFDNGAWIAAVTIILALLFGARHAVSVVYDKLFGG